MFNKKRLFVAIAVSVIAVIFAYLNFGKSPRVVETWNDSWTKPQDGFLSRKFVAQEDWRGKIVELDFDKLCGKYEIRMNENLIKSGEAKNGVSVDITKFLNFDSDNSITLKTASKGVLDKIKLVVKNPISVVGDSVKVDVISKGEGGFKISVRAEIKNILSSREKVDIYFEIKNGDGKVMAKRDFPLVIPQNSVSSCSAILSVDKPLESIISRLVEVSVVRGYEILDVDSVSF